ncbi:metalloregulator ArsR/SmtB family transcription factor [Clostridium algoriphilum]|uniref:ArsR/SmtB family transcription factor n=1 Tax=Clostridium algoriphilum TaxID=198347 RepID=UPI001CF5859C|nr:metalloregulator ArsR/SmtB family transcription factor [Clostridium algoriphilum]MCB2294527.1 metalloregulator ArsR/SmtB family transcription factor [Clostridium algoriphilum]
MNQDDLTVKIFKALGNPVRYKIMQYLCDGPQCVCKLNEKIEFSQANLSQHLRILKDAGLVNSQKVGLEMHYSVYNDDVKDIIEHVNKYVFGYVNNMKSSVK